MTKKYWSEMTDEEKKAKLAADKAHREAEIKAGTHAECPVCQGHVKVENGRIVAHDDMSAESVMTDRIYDDSDCRGSGRRVKSR